LPPGKSNNASALLNLSRNLGGGIGISLVITMLSRRSQFHLERLTSHLTTFDVPFRNQLQTLTHSFGGGAAAHDQALGVIYNMANQQASMLSYVEVFFIMSLACLPIAGLTLFVKRLKYGQHVEAPVH
jgi:DHA2 family multidrug resistance protein